MAASTPSQTASPPHTETETEEGRPSSKTSRPMSRLQLTAQKQLLFLAEQAKPIMALLKKEIPLESQLPHRRGASCTAVTLSSSSKLEITASMSHNSYHMHVATARQQVELHSTGEVMAPRDREERVNFDAMDTTIGKRPVGAIEPDSTGSGSRGNGSKKRKSTNPAHAGPEDKKANTGRCQKHTDALGGLPGSRR